MEVKLATTEVEEPLWVLDINGKRYWTTHGYKTVVDMYEANMTMAQIGAELGLNKNMIVGVIHRARKRGEMPKFEKKLTKPKRIRNRATPKYNPLALNIAKAVAAKAEKAPKIEPPKPKVRLRVIESGTAVTLEGLKPHMCKWPLGDPRYSDFRYCGKNRMEPGPSPYCPEHFLLGTQQLRNQR